MTTNKPDVTPYGRYSIKAAAQILGISESTLRIWIEKGCFQKGEVNKFKHGRHGTFILGRAISRIWNEILVEDDEPKNKKVKSITMVGVTTMTINSQ